MKAKLIFLIVLGLATTAFSVNNECKLFGTVQDTMDTADALSGVLVTLQLTSQKNNTCDSTITARFSKTEKTNANGYFSFNAVYSSCLDSAYYRLIFRFEGSEFYRDFLVPNQDSVNIFTLIGD